MTNKEFLQHLGMEIKVARIRQRLSQKQLAKLAGVEMRGINCIENGKTDSKILTYKRVTESLGISIKDLL